MCFTHLFLPLWQCLWSCVLKLWSLKIEPQARWSLHSWHNLCCDKLLRVRVTCCNSLANPTITNLGTFPRICGDISKRGMSRWKLTEVFPEGKETGLFFLSILFHPCLQATPGRNHIVYFQTTSSTGWACFCGSTKLRGRELQLFLWKTEGICRNGKCWGYWWDADSILQVIVGGSKAYLSVSW